MPLKPYQTKIHPHNNDVVNRPVTATVGSTYTERKNRHRFLFETDRVNHVVNGNIDDGIDHNLEWVFFSPYEEDSPGYQHKRDVKGPQRTQRPAQMLHGRESSNENNSVLSTRVSGDCDVEGLISSYVISDFESSYVSVERSEAGGLCEDMNSGDENDQDSDLDSGVSNGGYGKETDSGLTDEEHEADKDSLLGDVRERIDTVNRSQLEQLKNKQHSELVNKVNKWKFNVGSASYAGEKPGQDMYSTYTESNDTTFQEDEATKKDPKVEKVARGRSRENKRKSERKAVRKVVGKLYTALQRENVVEHEGVFMNNPELESCLPGYWKRIMLDNLLHYTCDHNAMLGMSVARDDISVRNKKFWEVEESGSVQSISTGWDGGNIWAF